MKRSDVAVVVIAIILYCVSFFLIPYIVFLPVKDFNEEINPEIVNGILTISAVLFAFWIPATHKLRFKQRIAIMLILSVQILSLVYAGSVYAGECVRLKHPTIDSLAVAMSSMTTNAFSYFIFQLCQLLWKGKNEKN